MPAVAPTGATRFAPGLREGFVVKSIIRIGLLALSASAAGCAGVQVHSVGTNSGQAAYDLVGPNLDILAAEAERLCPQGHAVMRQWQRGNRPADASEASATSAQIAAAFSYEIQPDQAQMSIVCKA
jgi:hypothetical protein